MSKSTLLLIFVLSLIAVLLGYNYFTRPFAKLSVNQSELVATPALEPKLSSSEQQILNLTDAQKISQLIAAPLVINNAAKDDVGEASGSGNLTWIKTYQPGIVTIFGQNIDRNAASVVIETIKQANQSGPEVWLAVDHEGGKVQRLNGAGFTKLPNWSVVCEQSEAELKAVLASAAAELKTTGIDVVLAPVVDVGDSTALSARICSDDREVVIEKASQFIDTFNQVGILPVIKHFPGIGQTTQDLHREFDMVIVGENEAVIYRTLLEKYPFLGVMVAPVGVKNQYQNIPCVLSPDCVGELTNNFSQTLIFTDALEMKANFHTEPSQPTRTLSEVAEQAIWSGNQVLVFGPSVSDKQLTEIVDALTAKYQSDKAFKHKVDQALNQLINYKSRKL